MIRKNFVAEYKFKLLWIIVTFFFLFAVIAIRLFLLQVCQKKFFTHLALGQYGVHIKVDQPRATIYDRSGIVQLAFNREVPSVFILPGQLSNAQCLEKFLLANYKDVYVRLKANPERHFLWVDRKLTPELLSFIMKQKLNDLQIINELQRFYSCQPMAQVIGFTDVDNMGVAGIELMFNKHLAGVPSVVKLEKDARSKSFYFTRIVEQPGVPGHAVTLTLDSTLQFLAFEELKAAVTFHHAKGGSVLIMEPTSGQVLAMVNYPDFNPHQKSISNLEITKNNVITDCFELGSVVKAFCALAAYEERAVKYDELIDCEGKTTVIDGLRVTNWKSVGVLPFYDVIKNSSNIGVAKIAKRLGPKLYEHLRRIGFGSKTSIEFPGERSGFVNPPDKWSRFSVLVMSFGYEIMASLVQLGRAFCIIANGGYSLAPTLLKDPAPAPFKPAKLYRDDTIALIKNTLEKIGERYPVKGCRIMGKTGTARCVKDGKYSKTAHVYTFAGIVEHGNYKRVIVTFVREPSQANLWAAGVAAPMFHNIAQKMVHYEMMKDNLMMV
jgi:cell division protein FtsI (penicillin-binding protein 3)